MATEVVKAFFFKDDTPYENYLGVLDEEEVVPFDLLISNLYGLVSALWRRNDPLSDIKDRNPITTKQLGKFRAQADSVRLDADGDAIAAPLRASGISILDYVVWQTADGGGYAKWLEEALTKLDESNYSDISLKAFALESSKACVTAQMNGNLALAVKRFEDRVLEKPISNYALKPIQNRSLVTTDTEFCRTLSSPTSFVQVNGVTTAYRKTLRASRTKDGRALKESYIDYLPYYGKDGLLNFDENVLMTAFDCALQNPLKEGGFGVSFTQVCRSYYKIPKSVKVEPQSPGMDVIRGSIKRLRESGFEMLDLSNAIDNNRLEWSSFKRIDEKIPFLNATVGLVAVRGIGGKTDYAEGMVIWSIPEMYRISLELKRLRDISGKMRPPKMERTVMIEERYSFMQSRLLMGIGGRKANNVTMQMFDQWDVNNEQVLTEGICRTFYADQDGNIHPLTRQMKRSACEWVEKLLAHWSNIGACEYVIEYEKRGNKPTATIRSIRLFHINKDVVFETKAVKLPNSSSNSTNRRNAPRFS